MLTGANLLKHVSSNENFLSKFQPILKINHACALLPINILKDEKGKHFVQESRKGIIYSYVAVSTVYTLHLYLVQFYAPIHYNDIRAVYGYGRMVLCFMTNMSCLWNRRLILRCLNEIADLGICLSNTWLGFEICLIAAIITFSFVGNYYLSATVLELLVRAYYNLTLSMVPAATCFQYVFQVMALQQVIKDTKEKISELSKEMNSSGRKVVRKIMTLYGNMCNVSSLINSAYGLPMFLVTSILFWEATFCTFFVFGSGPLTSTIGKAYTCLWTLFYASSSLLVMQICQMTENSAREVQELSGQINLTPECSTSTSDLLERIEFQMQLHHQKIRFSANGFFDLNGSLVKTVTSTILTYVVILLQIGITEDKE